MFGGGMYGAVLYGALCMWRWWGSLYEQNDKVKTLPSRILRMGAVNYPMQFDDAFVLETLNAF